MRAAFELIGPGLKLHQIKVSPVMASSLHQPGVLESRVYISSELNTLKLEPFFDVDVACSNPRSLNLATSERPPLSFWNGYKYHGISSRNYRLFSLGGLPTGKLHTHRLLRCNP